MKSPLPRWLGADKTTIDGEGTMARPQGGGRRLTAARGILAGLFGLLIAGPPCGAAEPAPITPPAPPIELRSPVAPEAGIRSVDYDSWIGPHVIQLMAGGTELEFIGGIGGSASAELARALDANPGVRVLQLTSQGGNTLLAMDMELLVRTRHLITYVPRFCASACAFVFLGGKERYVGPGAKLGFHAAVGLDESSAETARLAAAVKTWMLGRGVAPAFVDRAVSTPHTTIWEPTSDELLQARVITALSSPQRFATPSFGPGIPALVRQGPPQGDPLYLATQKLMLAIRKADPASYEQVHALLYEAMQDGGYGLMRAASVGAVAEAVLQRSVAVAADDAVVNLVNAGIEETERLASIDPAVCVELPTVTRSQQEAAMAALPADLLIRQITAWTMIVESATAHPQAPPSPDKARAILKVLERNLANTFDRKYILQPALDPARACAYRSAVLKAILGLEARDRSVLLRAMMAGLQ
jgi:hypothetical protein